MREYPDPRAPLPDAAVRAATRFARSIGHHGKVGGWIYDKNGRRLVQGWRTYAQRLAASRRLYREDGRWHVEDR